MSDKKHVDFRNEKDSNWLRNKKRKPKKAYEHPSEKELKDYLYDHPEADRSLHWVVNNPPPKSKSPKAPKSQPKVAPKKEEEIDVSEFEDYTLSVQDVLREDIDEGIVALMEDAEELRKAVEESENSELTQKQAKANRRVDRVVYDYTGMEYQKSSNLAHLVKAAVGGKEDDWRIKNKPVDEDIEEDCKSNGPLVEAMKRTMHKERAILKATGLVDDKGFFTAYRATTSVNGDFGEKVDYRGNYVDSWTLNPNLEWDRGTFIKARLHISQVVACYVGRGEDTWEEEECEVIAATLHGEGEIVAGKIERGFRSVIDDREKARWRKDMRRRLGTNSKAASIIDRIAADMVKAEGDVSISNPGFSTNVPSRRRKVLGPSGMKPNKVKTQTMQDVVKKKIACELLNIARLISRR